MERDLSNDEISCRIYPWLYPDQMEEYRDRAEREDERPDCIVLSIEFGNNESQFITMCEEIQGAFAGDPVPLVLLARDPNESIITNIRTRLRLSNIHRVESVFGGSIPGDYPPEEKLLRSIFISREQKQNMYEKFISTIKRVVGDQ